MRVLGLQGSPRKKGNTEYLLTTFLDEAQRYGAETEVIHVHQKKILPCRGCGYCEKKGYCVIKEDDMTKEIYPLLRQSEVIVIGTPIYFYHMTAQLKALVDRTQALWSRKYVLKLSDPAKNVRRGFLLSVAATKGKDLFKGLSLSIKYFFDPVGAKLNGSLLYRGMEGAGEIKTHPKVFDDISDNVKSLFTPLAERRKVLFTCRENTCLSQMAAAFAQYLSGDKIEVLCGGTDPMSEINPVMAESMQEKGIDMAFRRPRSIRRILSENTPDIIVNMGIDEKYLHIPGIDVIEWEFPDPSGKGIELMREVRDKIEQEVKTFSSRLT